MLSDRNFACRLESSLGHARKELIGCRNSTGHWTGELSSSALSTATAVCALAVVQRHGNRFDPTAESLIERGLQWLAQHTNPDGGWGDTILSLSNISTTSLVWAAFGSVPKADQRYHRIVAGAEAWLTRHAGGTRPGQVAQAIIQRYGKDRTFSVPILTMCALAGRLGEGESAWRWVLPLPFELAACPHQWFAALRLPVVSYALPALIGIGQARHHHLPSRNPIVRLLRMATRARTLRILREIQPASGGFLEATPLTSFVVMSLAASGQIENATVQNGSAFLRASARPDGSWPIDTNLATWVTTLSVNALCQGGESLRSARKETNALAPKTNLSADEWRVVGNWLKSQQYRDEHPYTHAAPGGWAWTDLPGGVPDADDTAGALLALRALGGIDDSVRRIAAGGVEWLMNLQNNDGGIPTFCKGWGALPFDRSSPDLTAHAIRAWRVWRDEMPIGLQRRLHRATSRAAQFLVNTQRPDGSWIPLWFGNQFAPDDENPTYGTSRVLLAFDAELLTRSDMFGKAFERGVDWLLGLPQADGSWGAGKGLPSSVEETSLAVEALAMSLPHVRPGNAQAGEDALQRGASWLMDRIERDTWREASPIGFYFAKLWYCERLYPLIFTVGALGSVKRWLDRLDKS